MKQLITLLAGVVFCYTAFATTFTVTSNADSGPGTLREAIIMANANGILVPDFIHFNFPNQTEVGRTINLQSELPQLTSNLTIDGTTQAGTNLGLSNARVTLYLDHYTSNPFSYFFILNATTVTIYGICFKFFDDPDSGGGLNYAIGLRNASNIIVGAPGKGNLFSAVRVGVSNNYWNYFNPDSVKNITIQNNVFGLSSTNQIVKGGLIDLRGAANITIGGPSLDKGNLHIRASIALHEIDNSASQFFAKIQNCRINVNWDNSFYYYSNSGSLSLTGNMIDDTLTTRTWLLDNVFCGSGLTGIGLYQLSHRVVVQGNELGLNAAGAACQYSPYDIGIDAYCKKILIGGYNTSEQNIIHGTIYVPKHGVHVLQNQISGTIENTSIAAPDPFIKITEYDNNLIKGVANSNAKIQLYTTECQSASSCFLKKYFAVTWADASGSWSFPYTLATPNLIATATISDSSTSAFTKVDVDYINYRVIKDATCGKSNGSIKGIKVYQGTHIRWYTSTNQLISTDTNLVNVPAGTYYLHVSNGANGCIFGLSFTINDISPPVILNPLPIITPATCGLNNGIISHTTYSFFRNIWYNNLMDSIGNASFVNNLAPGNYFFKLINLTDTSCYKLYGPFIVTNASGPSLNSNSVVLLPATCSNANGSIIGITAVNVTGIPFILWTDSLNNPVGNALDLLNVMPGKYRLKFKDQSTCDTIITPFYSIIGIGSIGIDTTGKIITPSKCSFNNGSIANIKITSGQTYTWINTATNAVMGNNINLTGMPPGNYQLTVSNSSGCSKQTPVINIGQTAFVPVAVTTYNLQHALCAQNTGAIAVTAFSNTASLFSFLWTDSITSQIIGTGNSITNLTGGTYQLFATDTNGCQQKIFGAAVKNMPLPIFDYTNMQLQNDQCNLSTGSIKNIAVTNLTGPTVYTWVNQNNVTVGSSINLQNIAAGTYILNVTDAGVCNLQSVPIILVNTDAALPAPLYDNLVIPRYSAANLRIKGAVTGSYLLLQNATASIPLQQNSSGNFTVPGINNDTVFYIKQANGTCISPTVAVTVKVVDKSFFAIPNAFTPNGDGINDRLNVRVIGYINLIYFKVYNKWGELVFETRKFTDGWDGKYKGELQNTGSYIWIAEGRDIQGNLLTDKGMFTLIR